MQDMTKKRYDAVLGGILLVVCAILIWATFQIKLEESRMLPLFTLGLIALCSVWLIFQTLVLHRSTATSLLHNKRELTVWAMFVVLVLLIRLLSFYSSAFLFLFTCHLYLSGSITKKNVLTSLLYAAVVAVALFLCFTLAVRMSLPSGLLI